MLADIARQRAAAVEQSKSTADRKRVETLVGRLGNLTQVFPEVSASLHGGYAIAKSSCPVAGRRRFPPTIPLRSGSSTHTEWVELLDLSAGILDANIGVDIAPQRAFPSRDSPGAITVTTDASGNDGVGGYAFAADDPLHVFIMSEPWPDDILRALANGAATEAERDCSAPSLSVTAVELFGTRAIAAAVMLARGRSASSITAVGDSDGAASVINSAASGNGQMRSLLSIASDPIWLAISVPREANVDADRLSHPARADDVIREAASVGLRVTRLPRLTEGDWSPLRHAASIGVASHHPSRRRRRRGPSSQSS